MRVQDKYPDTLQAIETAIQGVFRQHRDLTDYNVIWALEAAVARYKDVTRGRAVKPSKLAGLDATVLETILQACESWENPASQLKGAPLKPEELLDCLRRLLASAQFWNKDSGRTGYLNYVKQFIG
jgi:hypothetical protein